MREEEAPAAEQRPPRPAPVREALPLVKIRSSKDVAVMCARHHRLLRDYVEHALPDPTPDTVELVTSRAVERMLAIRRPRSGHGLLWAADHAKQEARHFLEGDRVRDVLLGEITPEVERAIDRLGRVWQRTLRLRLSGKMPREIAAAEGVSRAIVNQRLHNARRRVLQLMEETPRTAPALRG
jgi:DNA-directed RNA polymerase specialized sigma24 family protein